MTSKYHQERTASGGPSSGIPTPQDLKASLPAPTSNKIVRQSTAATYSGAGAAQHILNKENKALQNLLAAVELNRTGGGEFKAPPVRMNAAATGSAKQQ